MKKFPVGMVAVAVLMGALGATAQVQTLPVFDMQAVSFSAGSNVVDNATLAYTWQMPRQVPTSTAGIVFGYTALYSADEQTNLDLTITFEKSYDKTNWVTALVVAPSVEDDSETPAAITYVLSTNVTVADYGWLRLGEMTNAGTTTITNFYLRFFHK